MAKGVNIGSGYVDVNADLSSFDSAMAALPKKAGDKMAQAMKVLQAKAASVKLEIGKAYNQGDLATQQKLIPIYENLKTKIDAVTNAAVKQAQALQQAARAAQQQDARDFANMAAPKRYGKDSPSVTFDETGDAAKKAGKDIRDGSSNGAMGLLMLSQFIDDAQYGFRAVVNNIPTLTAALAQTFGASTKLGMQLGGIAGIAAVAINSIITHWDQLFDRFGYGTETMKAIWKQFWGDAKDITVDALDEIENRIKELQGKKIKTAVDLHETEQLKEQAKELQKGRQAMEQLKDARSPFEKESGEKIGQLFADTDAATMKRLQADLVTKRAEAMNAVSPAVQRTTLTAEEEAKIRAAVPDRSVPGGLYGDTTIAASKADQDAAVEAEKQRRRDAAALAKEVNKKKASDEIGGMIAKAKEGNTAGQAQLVQALVDAGYQGMAAMVQSLSPEAAAEAATGATQQESDARKAAVRDMLNEQGREGERAFFEQEYDKKAAVREMLNRQGRSGEQDYFQSLADERSREATRFAQQLQPRLSSSVTEMGGGTQEELEAKVKVALQQAGVAADDIGKMTTEVAAKLRMGVQERIQAKVLGGLTPEQAVRSVKQEDKDAQQALKKLPKSEIMSTEGYLNKLLVAGMSRESTEPKPVKLDDGQIGGVNDRLDKILDATKENKPGVARFAGGASDPARENGPMM